MFTGPVVFCLRQDINLNYILPGITEVILLDNPICNWGNPICWIWIGYLYWSNSGLVQFSRSVVSDSLQPHGPQHTRPPCPSQTPGVHPNSCASSQWCHPAISSFVVSLPSCPQSLPASGSFPMSQLFASGGQSIGVSALASVLPMNTQDWSPLQWTGWISLQSKGLSRVFSNTTVQKHQFFSDIKIEATITEKLKRHKFMSCQKWLLNTLMSLTGNEFSSTLYFHLPLLHYRNLKYANIVRITIGYESYY